MPAIQHESWFYEKFMMAAKDFRMESAADWACLRVYDGNTLKPAMSQGFQGTPSSEQLENLYKLAEQGKLVFFSLTKETPDAVILDGTARIEMNPVKPTEPAKPDENAKDSEKSKYDFEAMKYEKLTRNYEKAVEVLGKLGEGFGAAVEAYNNTRDMKAEQTEAESRAANRTYVKEQRRLNNADRLIDGVFGPRPVALADYFHHDENGPNDLVVRYDKFDEQFAANGYDLPADSKLNAQEVATINFAMAGASKFVENYYKKELKAGDAAAKNGAGSFQPLVTSCFSNARIGQALEEYGVLGEAFKLGKDVVAQYNGGNAGPLGAHLADCVRNLKATGTGYHWDKLCADMVAGARLIERIQELFDKHEDIKKAANLTEKELEFMRGYVQLGKAYDHYLTSMIINDLFTKGRPQGKQHIDVLEPARKKAKEALDAYAANNPEPLAKLLVRSIQMTNREARSLTTSGTDSEHAIDTVYLISRLYNTLNGILGGDPKRMEAVGLNQQDLDETLGNVAFYEMLNRNYEAKQKLIEYSIGERDLSEEELLEAGKDMLLSAMVSKEHSLFYSKESERIQASPEQAANLERLAAANEYGQLLLDIPRVEAKGEADRLQKLKERQTKLQEQYGFGSGQYTLEEEKRIATGKVTLVDNTRSPYPINQDLRNPKWVETFKNQLAEKADLRNLMACPRDYVGKILGMKTSVIELADKALSKLVKEEQKKDLHKAEKEVQLEQSQQKEVQFQFGGL